MQIQVERQVDYEPDVTTHGRGLRPRKPVQRFKDFTLTSTIPFDMPSTPAEDLRQDPSASLDAASSSQLPESRSTLGAVTEPEAMRGAVWDDALWKKTPGNAFGLYKKYWTTEEHPHDPDRYISGKDLQEDAENEELEGPLTKAGTFNDIHPFPNLNSFLLGEWYWSDRTDKSRESFRELLDIITSPEFDPEDIRGADWNRINSSLASSEFDDPGKPHPDWITDGTSRRSAAVTLEVPFNSTSLDPGAHAFSVPNFRYRPLVPIITERLRDVARGEQFHIVPVDLRWLPFEGGLDSRVYGELHSSPAFIEAFKEVQVSDGFPVHLLG